MESPSLCGYILGLCSASMLVWPPSSEFVPTWISYLLEFYTLQFDPDVILIHCLCVTWCWWSSSNCILLCHGRQDFLGKAPWLIGSLGTVTLDITLLVQVCSWTCFTFFFHKWPKLAACLLGLQDHPVQWVLKDLGISLEKKFSVRQLLRRLFLINCAGTLLGLSLKDEEG